MIRKYTLKSSLLVFFLMITANLQSQTLLIKDLEKILQMSNWQVVNNKLVEDDWQFYDSKNRGDDQINTITWAYKLNRNNLAAAWFYLYSCDNVPSKLSYQFFNEKSYKEFTRSFKQANYQLKKSEIKDGELVSSYKSSEYILETIITKKEKEYSSNYNSYHLTLIKKNGLFDDENGSKTSFYDNGELKASYKLNDGKLDGLYFGYYENGNLKAKINYSNNKRHGKAKWFYSSGKIKSEANYSNHALVGEKLYYNENGQITSKCYYKDDKLEGSYIQFSYADDDKLRSKSRYNFINDLKEGIYQEFRYNDDGNEDLRVVGNYKANKLDGTVYTFLVSNNNIVDTIEVRNFREGQKHGQFQEFYNDTLIYSNYNSGNLEGKYLKQVLIEMYNLGMETTTSTWFLSEEGSYKLNKKEGLWTYYNMSQKSEEGQYIDNKREGKWIHYLTFGNRSEEVYKEVEFKSGMKDGLEKVYFDNSMEYDPNSDSYLFKSKRINECTEYSNGDKHGKYTLKDSLNNTLIIGEFSHGKKHNKWMYYNKNKEIERVENYISDKLTYIEKYHQNNLISKSYFKDSKIYETQQIEKSFTKRRIKVLLKYMNTVEVKNYKKNNENYYEYFTCIADSITDKEIFISKKLNKNGKAQIYSDNKILVDGYYLNNQKEDKWTIYLHEIDLKIIKQYKHGKMIFELFYTISDNLPISGKINLTHEDKSEIIKLKEGKRSGITVFKNFNGIVIKKEKYKNGIKL